MPERLKWACAECKSSKARCDAGKPQCGRCISRGYDCLEVENPIPSQTTKKKPGPIRATCDACFKAKDKCRGIPCTRCKKQRIPCSHAKKASFHEEPLGESKSMAPQVPPWGVPYDGKSALPPIASLRNPGIDQSGHLSTNQPTGQGLVRRRNPIARSHGPASFASAAQNTISYGSYYAGASSNAWAAQTNTDQAAPNYLGTSGTAMVDTRWPQQGLRVANAQFQRNLPQVAMGFDGGARSNHATALNTIPTKWSGGYVEPEEVDDGIPFDLKLTDTNQATESYLGTLGTNLVGRQWPRQYFPVNDAGFQGNLSGTMTTAPKYQLPIRQQGMDVTDYAPLIDPNLLVSPFGSEKQTEHHETDPDHRGTNYIDPYSSNTDYTDYSGNNYR